MTLEAKFAAAFVANLIDQFFSGEVHQVFIDALALQLVKHGVGFGIFALHGQGFCQIQVGFGSAEGETIGDVVGFGGALILIGQSQAVGEGIGAEEGIATRIERRIQFVEFT